MTNAQIATKIAKYLFTNGLGQRALRLVLELPGGKDGGGWSERAVSDAIEKILNDQSIAKKKP